MNNARDIGVVVETQELVTQKQTAVKESFVYINHLIQEKSVVVKTAMYNSDGNKIKEGTITISDSDYDNLLNGEGINFRYNKIKGEFNEEDVWLIIDHIRY